MLHNTSFEKILLVLIFDSLNYCFHGISSVATHFMSTPNSNSPSTSRCEWRREFFNFWSHSFEYEIVTSSNPVTLISECVSKSVISFSLWSLKNSFTSSHCRDNGVIAVASQAPAWSIIALKRRQFAYSASNQLLNWAMTVLNPLVDSGASIAKSS